MTSLASAHSAPTAVARAHYSLECLQLAVALQSLRQRNRGPIANLVVEQAGGSGRYNEHNTTSFEAFPRILPINTHSPKCTQSAITLKCLCQRARALIANLVVPQTAMRSEVTSLNVFQRIRHPQLPSIPTINSLELLQAAVFLQRLRQRTHAALPNLVVAQTAGAEEKVEQRLKYESMLLEALSRILRLYSTIHAECNSQERLQAVVVLQRLGQRTCTRILNLVAA